MLVGCKNCGGYFTPAEIEKLRRPAHKWSLTPGGEQMLAQNTASGAHVLCPKCGHNTLGLGAAPVPPSQ